MTCGRTSSSTGGASLLRTLNVQAELYHLNEGHSALLTLCLLDWQLDGRQSFELDESDLALQQGKPVIFHCGSGARTLAHAPAAADDRGGRYF